MVSSRSYHIFRAGFCDSLDATKSWHRGCGWGGKKSVGIICCISWDFYTSWWYKHRWWFHGISSNYNDHSMGFSSHENPSLLVLSPSLRFERVFRVLNAMEAGKPGLWPWNTVVWNLVTNIWEAQFWDRPNIVNMFNGKIWNEYQTWEFGIVWRCLEVFSDKTTQHPLLMCVFHWVFSNTSCGKVESSQWRTWSQNFDESEW